MRDPEFYRHMISKRVAVAALVQINKALGQSGSNYFWGYENGSPGEYDSAVYSMADEVRVLKEEVEEYRELKKALKNVLS